MRRLLTVLAGVGLAGVGLAAGLALTAAPTAGGVYSLQRLDQELHLHPRAWIGQMVSVRALAVTYWWGSGHGVVAGHQTLLVDPADPDHFVVIPYGARLPRLNNAGASPSLLIAGPMPPPSGGNRLRIILAHLPVIDRLVGADPTNGPDVYRVRIVGAGPCPPVLSGFCPLSTIAP